jgi:hypothetical protein
VRAAVGEPGLEGEPDDDEGGAGNGALGLLVEYCLVEPYLVLVQAGLVLSAWKHSSTAQRVPATLTRRASGIGCGV